MSKAQAMQADRLVRRQRPPEPLPGPAPRALLRWVRHGSRWRLWRPWWLLGLLEVVTYPYPRFRTGRADYIPGIRASCGLPARPGIMRRVAA